MRTLEDIIADQKDLDMELWGINLIRGLIGIHDDAIGKQYIYDRMNDLHREIAKLARSENE